MIDLLRGEFRDKSVAIIGGGPTADLYSGKEDHAIACNGGCMIDRDYDYFLAADIKAPQREWWNESHGAVTRIIASYLAPFDQQLYPNPADRLRLLSELDKIVEMHWDTENPHLLFQPRISPSCPHIIFANGGFDDGSRTLPSSSRLYTGGTVAAMALQAGVIGMAEQINIYGCGFNNDSGENYYYRAAKDESGMTSLQQRLVMQNNIDKARRMNIDVRVLGESRLV